MKPPPIEILAYEETPLGPLCLRRRLTLSEPQQRVTEVTLNHEFLMSSLHTDSERALATLPLATVTGERLSVLIGGLGLGYTAHTALADQRVADVEVVEYLPQVIEWMREGLIPLSSDLNDNPRVSFTEGDIFDRLLSPPASVLHDAILIDVDHSPEDRLADANAAFYTADGLARAAQHLRAGGVVALWSYDHDTPLREAMQQVLTDVQVQPITYFNQHVQEEFTDWLYLGRRRE